MLQVLGAIGVIIHAARTVDAAPFVACALVAAMASLASLSDDAAGAALNAAHAPSILVVAALALLCGLRVERTHSIPWAVLCFAFAGLALALFDTRRLVVVGVLVNRLLHGRDEVSKQHMTCRRIGAVEALVHVLERFWK